MKKLCPAVINLTAFKRRKQKNCCNIQKQKDKNENKNWANLFPVGFGEFKTDYADDKHGCKNSGVVSEQAEKEA